MQPWHSMGLDKDAAAFLEAVAIRLPEENYDIWRATLQNAYKIADEWAVEDGRAYSPLAHACGRHNDTNLTIEVLAKFWYELYLRDAIQNGTIRIKPCDACGVDFERPSFSSKQWKSSAGRRRCLACVEQGAPVIFSDDYRPFVRGGDSRMESLLGQKELLVEIVKGFWNPSSDNLRKWPENLIEVVLAQPEHFMFFGKLYYYKEKFLQDVGKIPSHEFFLVKKAIHDLPGDIFHKLSAEVRETIPMGMEKLRLTCKRLFLWVDRNSKVVPLGPESCGEGAGAPEDDEDDFVPSIKRLVDDLIPMLQPEDRHYIDRFLNTFDGKPLTSEQRKHPDWIKLAGLCFDVCVGSPEPSVISRIDAGIFNRCVERQRDEFRQATDSERYKPTYPGLPLRRQCDVCGVDKALAEWRYPYCTSCNVHWLSPRFRRMDRLNGCCPICLLPPKSAEFSYTLRCGHALHLKCLEYAKSVRAECPGEQILSVCPVCSDPITDDLEKVVFVQDVWPEHMEWWPGPDHLDVAFSAESAAECAHLAASAAVRDLSALVYYHQHLAEAVAAKEKFWEDAVVRALLKVKSPACFCESLRLLPCRDSVDAATKEEVT